ncbi:MAG: hypothetical protein M0P01_02065 [Treponema sp.]|nr:hypothetical protein [Treponema sp.]
METNGFSLDIKNPNIPQEETTHTTKELLTLLHESFGKSDQLISELSKELRE